MKTKTLSLFATSVLALFLMISLVSALIIYDPIELIGSADSGTTASIEFNMENDYSGDFSEITFEFTNLVFGSNSIDDSNLEVPEIDDITVIEGGDDLDVTLEITIPSDQEPGEYIGSVEFFGKIGSGSSLSRGVLNITLTVTEAPVTNEPEEIQECSITGNNGELEIKVGDINTVTGFGDDEDYWYLGDEVEIELEFDNKGEWDLSNIDVEWCLYDNENDECVMDDEESDFDLDKGDDDTMMITLNLDPDDFKDSEDYTFYAWATGEIDDNDAGSLDGENTCTSDSEDITINVDNDFVILNNLEVTPETLQCGGSLHVSANVWNIGSDDQDDVYVRIYNDYLGIHEQVDLGDIDSFEDKKLDIYLDIPADVDEKTYELLFQVYDEDDDLYENDEDDTAEFYNLINIEGGCVVEQTVLVVASVQSGGEEGEDLVIKATVTNTGEEVSTFTLNLAQYSSWASSANLDSETLLLNAGASQDVLITLAVNDDAAGDQSFDLKVLSEGEVVLTQPIAVSIQESGFNWNMTGNTILGDNWYLWGIGALNVILVLIIIFVAIRVARK